MIEYDRWGGCSECGATVNIDARDRHAKWHDDLVAVLRNLAERTQR